MRAACLEKPALAMAASLMNDSNPGLIGKRLGAYQVCGALGAGGMGEVYRARDTRLGRDVAIKILPHLFTLDRERLARFEREARVLASLNHPHIAAIYGIEESDGVRALVLELVEGETIAERIARGPIPLDEAIRLARQIADALEAAHQKGIIHRDLKPANIGVTRDGVIKVLDFGLAKAVEADTLDVSQSPTLTVGGTRDGVLLGTVGYMSPEQARGKDVDKRTDIWAFACVLYEMLTGRPAFSGETTSDTIAAVLEREPDWRTLPHPAPPGVVRLLRRALEKDPHRRLRDIGDARLDLDEGDQSQLPATRQIAPTRWQRALSWTAAAALAVALALVVMSGAPWRKAVAAPPLRFTAELGAGVSLAGGVLGPPAVLSPDGQTLAFVARKAADEPSLLYIRRLGELQATPLTGTDGARHPFVSPDGQWVGFFADRKLKRIAVTGGAPSTLADVKDDRGAAWGDDGTIAFAPDSSPGISLWRIPSTGGIAEPLTKLEPGEVTHRWPQMLPGAKAILFTAHDDVLGFDEANLVVQALPDGARKIVYRGGYAGRYLPSGHLVFGRGGTLFAAPFDLDRLEVTGTAVPMVPGIWGTPLSGSLQYAISNNGTLAYVPIPRNEVPIHWIERDGKVTPLRPTPADWGNVRFSPDGTKVAMNISDGSQRDIWMYEWARDALSRLTTDRGDDTEPIWTVDGRRIVFTSTRGDNTARNLYWMRSDGSDEPQRLTESKNLQDPYSWHPNGRLLAFSEVNQQSDFDIMILPMEGDERSGWKPGKPTVFLKTPFGELAPAFSPDGRWIAYQSDESGQFEVYVRPFPGLGGKWQISAGGGVEPVWSPTRHELFFGTATLGTAPGRIMVAEYTVEGDSFRAEKPHVWTQTRYTSRFPQWSFNLHPDGQRFAFAAASEIESSAKQDKVTFIFNFFDELRRLAPPGKPWYGDDSRSLGPGRSALSRSADAFG